MSKNLFIAEKPSVAQEFAKALKEPMTRQDGFLESENYVVTWCYGHLVSMSYPEKYDMALKRWNMATLPFIPAEYLYEVIPSAKKQFKVVSTLLKRKDVGCIYVCTDSGREGEYIYRLVEQLAKVKGKERRRVWIDSQTEEEILRGIREAKDLSEYDRLSDSAYLRAIHDYLMGINFSRLLSLKYGSIVAEQMNTPYSVIAVGRVMTCVLGMIVAREREIRDFVKTPFYRVILDTVYTDNPLEAEFRAVQGSAYYQSPKLYKDNGFREKTDAEQLIRELTKNMPVETTVDSAVWKKERKNPPLLYNLAELQNDCSRMFKISPDETLKIVQELYEKKLVTYPRTDARVLSTAVAKEITKNLSGLTGYPVAAPFASEILNNGSFQGLEKTRYVNDKAITDHYAIIPTGQAVNALQKLPSLNQSVYQLIVRRFLSIFYPAAVYEKGNLCLACGTEKFFASFRALVDPGYLRVADPKFGKNTEEDSKNSSEDKLIGANLLESLKQLKKGDVLPVNGFAIREGETAPPKRYNSGSMILAMENAGQLIEDEELRSQIIGSGIGTSATRAEILSKLEKDAYISLNKKTQILTPTFLGEMIYDTVYVSIRPLLNPELTASWEKGLTMVAGGSISREEYRQKMESFIVRRTEGVKTQNYQEALKARFQQIKAFYPEKGKTGKTAGRKRTAAKK